MRFSFKRLLSLLLVTLIAMFAVVAFGADPSPVPIPGPTGTINWTLLIAAVAPLALAVLDFLFAVNPNAKSNGILHWIYLALGGKETPQPPK